MQAAHVLPTGHRRWTVDLYLSGTSHLVLHTDRILIFTSLAGLAQGLRTTLIEEYSNEGNPHPVKFTANMVIPFSKRFTDR